MNTTTTSYKNILYLGPYKQTDYSGQAALKNLKSVMSMKNTNIIARHVPINNSQMVDISSIVDESRINRIDTSIVASLDLIIQNVPLSFLSTNFYTKNICIPFVNTYQTYSDNQFDNFDHVLLDNFYSKNNFTASDQKKIQTFDIGQPIIVDNCDQKQMNIEKANHCYRFGFIGNYNTDYHIIQKLIQAFMIAFRSTNDVCLCMMINIDESDKSRLEEITNDIKKSLKIVDYNKIIFIYTLCNHVDSIVFLNNLNCYISINASTPYSLYENYCKIKNINYISYNNLQYNSMPQIEINSIDDVGIVHKSITTESLILKLKEQIHQNSVTTHKSKQKHKTLEDILCTLV